MIKVFRSEKTHQWLIAFSLSHLCFVRLWDTILHNPRAQFVTNISFNKIDYLAAIVILSVTTIIFRTCFCVVDSDKATLRWTARGAVIALCLPVVDYIRRFTIEWITQTHRFGISGVLIVAAIALLFCIVIITRGRRIWSVISLCLVPAALYTLCSLLLQTAKSSWPVDHVDSHWTSTEVRRDDKKLRVVWIIFDEWDYEFTFNKRPPSLNLPNLDAFSNSALVATNAYPPGGNTLVSVPSLLLGTYLEEVKPLAWGELQVRRQGEKNLRNFREYESLLKLEKGNDTRVAVTGWYLPYPKLTSGEKHYVTEWQPMPTAVAMRGEGVWSTAVAQVGYTYFPPGAFRNWEKPFLETHKFARLAVARPEQDVVFAHYSIPHLPAIYEPTTKAIGYRIKPSREAYISNLALLDRCLGEVMEDIRCSGLDRCTVIILSSDHWWRTSPITDGVRSSRVPFLIRFPGEKSRTEFGNNFNTVNTFGIVKEITSGNISSRSGAVDYMDKQPKYEQFRYDPRGYIQPIKKINKDSVQRP